MSAALISNEQHPRMTDLPPITILVVDDSRADARLAQLWLRSSAVVRDVELVHSGREALAFLRREGPFAQAPIPHMLVLDVHLPDMLGWELLVKLRQDEALSGIPVVVLTGTVTDADAQRARELGVARYLCKPFDADEFTALVREIETVALECHLRLKPND